MMGMVAVPVGRMILTSGDHIAVQVVAVIVIMVVDRQAFGYQWAKSFNKRRIMRDIRWVATATDVLIQTDHFVSSGHDQM